MKTTKQWTLKSANEHFKNVMDAANAPHNWTVEKYGEGCSSYFWIKEKATGENLMSWSWSTLRQLMNEIENKPERFIEAMRETHSAVAA